MKEIRNMIVVGSGHVAWHLIRSFRLRGIEVLQVLGRNEEKTISLSRELGVPYIMNPGAVRKNADLYLLAVQDDQVRPAALSLDLKDRLLVHTSGFTGLDALQGASSQTGVLWPLQTLTRGRETDLSVVPLFIEGSAPDVMDTLEQFARLVSGTVYPAPSEVRRKLHLAAVIASNLTNHLYSVAASILEDQKIPWEVLGPLIRETALKASLGHPATSQTGPAVRNDRRVIEKQLEMLLEEPEIREIYRLITEHIIENHQNKNEEL